MGRGANGTRQTSAAARSRSPLRPDRDRDVLYRNLNRLGIDAWDVGGGPRDDEMGRKPNDRDVAVSGISLAELHERIKDQGTVIPLEIVTDRGRVQVGWRLRAPWTDPEGIEIMLAREEVSTGPRHQDFEIMPIDAKLVDELIARGMTRDEAHREFMRRDAVRRDWTVNAVMRNVRTGETADFVGGLQDIRDRILRPISPDTCRDDPMRTLRGISRISQDCLAPTEEAEQQIRENAHRLVHLTQDKIFKELVKTLKGPHVSRALHFACNTGALQHAIPEFAKSVGYDQMSPYHSLRAHAHMILVTQRAVDINAPMPVRIAAILHDVGKAEMGWARPGETRLRFMRNDAAADRWDPSRFGHEEWSVVLAEQAMDRWQVSNELRADVLPLIAEHMFKDDQDFEKRTPLRQRIVAVQFIQRVASDRLDDRERTRELIENLLSPRYCDRAAKQEGEVPPRAETMFERVVRQELETCPLHKSSLTLKGGELIKAGLKPGPHVGEIERELLHRIQTSEDPQAAGRRSGTPLAEVIAARGDKAAFRKFPFIERWAADAFVAAERKLKHAA